MPAALSPGHSTLPRRRALLSLAMHPPLSLSWQQERELQQSLEGARAVHEEMLTLPGGRCAALAASVQAWDGAVPSKL